MKFFKDQEYKYFVLFYVYFIYFYISWNEEKVIISLILSIFYFFTIIYGNFFFMIFKNHANSLKTVYNSCNYKFILITIGSLIRALKNHKIGLFRLFIILRSNFYNYIRSIFDHNLMFAKTVLYKYKFINSIVHGFVR